MTSSPDIAIIGVGLHPFGRYEDRSALEMGAVAIHRALKDAGVDWTQVQSLYAGSLEVANPEAVTGLVGMTGIPARATLSGCATGNSLLTLAARDVIAGEADIAVGVGLDKHPRGAFGADPAVSGLPQWYGDSGMFLTTHYFGTKIMRYMHDHGITEQTLAKVAEKKLCQRGADAARLAA
jgi:acetyl-CoA C-acetyltransferase